MTKSPFLNALIATLYIVLVASVMYYGSSFTRNVEGVIIPVAVLSLFVLSATVMAFVFSYQPFLLFFEGRKKEGIDLLLKTLVIFAVTTAVILFAWFSLSVFVQ